MRSIRRTVAIGRLSCLLLVACDNTVDSTTPPSGTTSIGSGVGGHAGSGTSTGTTGGGGTAGGGTNPEAGSQTDGSQCSSACPSGAICIDGGCACPAYQPDACAGECTDLKVDPNHCGTCLTACPVGAV